MTDPHDSHIIFNYAKVLARLAIGSLNYNRSAITAELQQQKLIWERFPHSPIHNYTCITVILTLFQNE